MAQIRYHDHLEGVLQQRGLPRDWPREIIRKSIDRYRDVQTGYPVAVEEREVSNVKCEVAVVYDELPGGELLAITIFVLDPGERERRIRQGRWQPR